LYWMWRKDREYSQLVEFSSDAGKLATGHTARFRYPPKAHLFFSTAVQLVTIFNGSELVSGAAAPMKR